MAPGALALIAYARPGSLSALSTAVYAAGLMIQPGFVSRINRRMARVSQRSRSERVGATMVPNGCRRGRRSPPTCPLAPVNRIRRLESGIFGVNLLLITISEVELTRAPGGEVTRRP